MLVEALSQMSKAVNNQTTCNAILILQLYESHMPWSLHSPTVLLLRPWDHAASLGAVYTLLL